MAAVAGRGNGGSLPRSVRRRWLIGLVAVWVLVVAGLAVWSVPHERATVPEQRDIGSAVPELQRAAGALFAAAGGAGRAVVLGELTFSGACRVTPVRDGVAAVRDVTVQVRAGEARAALDAVAVGLPAGYRAGVVGGRGGTRFSLHADAGNFIGIDADSDAGAREVTVQVSTGCRPRGGGDQGRIDPGAPAAPAVLDAVLRALGAPPATFPAAGGSGPGGAGATGVGPGGAGTTGVGSGGAGTTGVVRAVSCPGGAVAGTYVVDRVAVPPGVEQKLRFLGVAGVIREDGDVRAYRTGNDSVVLAFAEEQVRVSVSTSC